MCRRDGHIIRSVIEGENREVRGAGERITGLRLDYVCRGRLYRSQVGASPVLFNDSLESAALPRTRYHVCDRSSLPHTRILNAQEHFAIVRSFTEQTISNLYHLFVYCVHSITALLSRLMTKQAISF